MTLSSPCRGYSRGFVLIALIAVLSSLAVLLWPVAKRSGVEFWVFATFHYPFYRAPVAQWNREHPERPVELSLQPLPALETRLLSVLRTGAPVADMMEVERMIAAEMFIGPLDAVGFVDLTERLRAGGWLERFNEPSFSPWTSRGRIFGLPHDVHPVLLAYRADLVEAAGIDVARIETWEDFARELAPLMAERGPDGRPLRYLLNFWPAQIEQTEIFLLQAGGGFFDEHDRPALVTEVNVRVLAQLAAWCAGPSRIATDAADVTALGNRIRLEGGVVCSPMADWMSGLWRHDLPGLAGKMKLMPLPAWERGGRRTSVHGGTGLVISSNSDDVGSAFELALRLYTSPELSDAMFRDTGIIGALRDQWSRPVYDEPNSYFSGQAVGRLYIEQAPQVPRRSSSPYTVEARRGYCIALRQLVDWAETHHTYDRPALEQRARELLEGVQADLVRRVERNVYLREGGQR